MDKLSILKSVIIFSGIDDKLLSKLTNQLAEAKYSAGSLIFKEKDKADAFFIVDSGEVVISKQLGPGYEKSLAVLSKGSVFGEMAFFSESPRTANARAKTDSSLWKIERTKFMNFLSEEPKAGLKILSGLLEVSMGRLEQTSRELATVYQTGKIISSTNSLSQIVKSVQDEILLAIPEAQKALTYLYNEFNQEYDPQGGDGTAKEISSAHPLVNAAAKNSQGMLLDNPSEIGIEKEGLFANTKSLLLAPMIKSDKLLGFIILWNNNKSNVFKTSHSLLVSSVAGQLAEAIENIRHQQEEHDKQRLNNAKQKY